MGRRWEDRKRIATSVGVLGLAGHVCWFLGIIFAVLGVIGAAVNITLGLGSISWLLLAIAAFVASIPNFLGWAVAVYLSVTETKSKKEGTKEKITDKKTLLIEYQEGSKICMHYETLRRNALVFFVVFQGAIMSVLFGLRRVTPTLEISLSSIAILVGLLVINNDIRLIDYYFGYLERLDEIEKELGMKLYSVQRKKIMATTTSVPNIIFFWAFPLAVSVFWIYIIAKVLLRFT